MTDEPSLSNLYRRYRQDLVDYAGRVSGDRANAEDIVHDAWLRLDAQPGAGAIREPLAYLKRVIRNLSIDLARRRARRGDESDDAAAQVVANVPDETPSQHVQVAARQEMERVLAAITDMPDRQKQVMILYHFEGLTIREVADRLHISRTMTHDLIRDGLRLCALRREGRARQ